ncbi:MAG: RelA/SpoT domain-containing protein [Gammaproteobacteria bacterium]|nr:RelA/SpoT domain-containing protein [Gammaproteobacteria bacterium]MCW8923133.1 RelA/SpoT domain-containing protein [Gammaproteobacteria bacterium]
MANLKINKKESILIDALVEEYKNHAGQIETFLNVFRTYLSENDELNKHIHSIKTRMKDPEHLRDKLQRKILKHKQEKTKFTITSENLLTEINDLAGIRILHLHNSQMQHIDPLLQDIFAENSYRLIEGPGARTWDDEYRKYFESINIEVQVSETLYTSVHYVVGSASRLKMTCEVQVRTLSEEIWGEVDHQLNYPHKTNSLACAEQLKVLARVTSSTTRLVDSIFRSYDDYYKEKGVVNKKSK